MAALCLLANPAAADTSTIFTSGNWSAFAGTVDTGEPVCGIVEASESKAFALKWFEGDSRLTIHLYDDSWVASPGTVVPVTFTFDKHAPWSAKAQATRQAGGHVVLEAYIGGDSDIREFVSELAKSNEMRISFPSSMRPDWIGPLDGSSASLNAMTKCVAYLGDHQPDTSSGSQTGTVDPNTHGTASSGEIHL